MTVSKFFLSFTLLLFPHFTAENETKLYLLFNLRFFVS